MTQIYENQLALLKDMVDALREGAVYLATDGDIIAQKARRRLEIKGPNDAAFFANLCSDLEELGNALEATAYPSISVNEALMSAAHRLLTLIQDHYLKDSDDSDSEDERQPSSPFAPLERFIHTLINSNHGRTLAERAIWLCNETKLTKTRSKQRRHLLDMIKICNGLIKPLNKTHLSDGHIKQDGVSIDVWDIPAFKNAEEFHGALSEKWNCDCSVEQHHEDAIFSFHTTPELKHCCSEGVVYLRTEEKGFIGWKPSQFEYHDERMSAQLSTSIEVPPRSPTYDQLIHGQFCALTDRALAGDLILITAESTVLYRNATCKGPGTGFTKNLPLSSCFKLPNDHPVYSLSSKRRMMYALYLAYAYLHLSGGCWWPYTVRSSVMLPDKIDLNFPPLAFFATSLLKGSDTHKPGTHFEIVERLNRHMPSLVAFGRLLLELFVGRAVIWDCVETELTNCVEDPFASEMIAAVQACLKPHYSEFPSTIRDDERLRNAFINDVILPIQEILQHGYRVKFQDIFFAPPVAKTFRVSVSRLVVQSSSHTVFPDRTKPIPAGFCLHDGHDILQELDKQCATDADSYMEKLQECNGLALYSDLCPGEEESTDVDPVKVAILDTGAKISEEQYKHVYSGRLKECRTWLTTTAAEGEEFPLGTSDDDGHGTHGTSVLLQATQNTDILVYVAQVFSGRDEKLAREQNNDINTIDRIVNAINYAVNVWKVNVISMSFGFPRRVKAIEEAISDAERKGVLMLAAASNCGGNDKRSWPARDSRIICIYACTGIGNKYLRNPNALSYKDNFAVLGTSVQAIWPNQEKPARKSGTSTATPICAAIAAVIISVLRRSKGKYITASQRPGQDLESLGEDYQEKVEVVGRANNMANVLRLMVGDGGIRDNYHYITPWTIFNKERSTISIVEAILQAIDA